MWLHVIKETKSSKKGKNKKNFFWILEIVVLWPLNCYPFTFRFYYWKCLPCSCIFILRFLLFLHRKDTHWIYIYKQREKDTRFRTLMAISIWYFSYFKWTIKFLCILFDCCWEHLKFFYEPPTFSSGRTHNLAWQFAIVEKHIKKTFRKIF